MSPPVAHRAWHASAALVVCLFLVGCEASRTRIETAPLAHADDDTVVAVPEVTTSAELVAASALGEPLAGLDAGELARFAAGEAEFEQPEDVADGLGPVF